MTLATYVTLFRLLLGPIFFFLYSKSALLGIDPRNVPVVLIVVLFFSESSDAIDGYLARRFNAVTDLGKILDPMADSVSRTSVFLTFTQEPVCLPIPLVFVFFYIKILHLQILCVLS